MKKRFVDENCALSITDLCYLDGISVYTYNSLRKRGLGPKETRYPGTQIVRISPEARREWHARLEQRDAQKQIERERKRRTDIAQRAGKLAVQSPKHPRTGAKPTKRGPGRPRNPQPQQAAE